ncbi:MAG: hypothetical protein KAH38_02240, partial [Candidatus Hydrogenedentes bacterium]|nr:hypothetical protein [Candidatus Hydrogenedentota bacterium]
APEYYADRQAVMLEEGSTLALDFRLLPISEIEGESVEGEGDGEGEYIEGEEEGEEELPPGCFACRGCLRISDAPENTKRLLGDWLLVGLSLLVLCSIRYSKIK